MIDGTPLNTWTGADGSVQFNVDGAPGSEFYPPNGFDPVTGQSAPSNVAFAGFAITLDPAGRATRYGKFFGSMPNPESGPTLTDPQTITTSWILPGADGSPAVRLGQVLHYANGSRQVDGTYTVQNLTGAAIPIRALVVGDLAIRGTDTGIGFVLGAPPTRFIGGLNQAVGAAGGFVEVTPWTHFETNTLSSVSTHAFDSTGPGFDDSSSTQEADNAAGVQWDDVLVAGATKTYSLGYRFVDTLGLSPVSGTEAVGSQHSVTATAAGLDGKVAAAKKLRYSVQGVNPVDGSVTTGANGMATIAWVGASVGQDQLTVFEDTNNNGTRDDTEAQAVATVDWTGPQLPPPTIGQTASAMRISGKVKIKLPKGTSAVTAKRLGFHGAAAKFRPLAGAAQIPIGSTLDTTKGTVQLLTAGSKPSATTGVSSYQSGQFRSGLFTLGQTRKNPLVQLSMSGGNLRSCKTGLSRGSAARSKKRRLFGNAHGRFRTRGRSSSATVRGTAWSMIDTCGGTLTSVSRGSVLVRDFRLRKNKTVKAGHRYFARAPKKKAKRKH